MDWAGLKPKGRPNAPKNAIHLRGPGNSCRRHFWNVRCSHTAVTIRFFILLLASAMPLSAAAWLTDSATAYQRARTENKPILFNFTGSDWCGWCMRLQSEVFSHPEFEAFAKDNLVLVEVDFPKSKAQAPSQIKANASLASGFNIRGYPTILLVDGQGKIIGRTGYQPGGPRMYIAELQRILGNRVKVPYDTGASATGSPGSSAAPVSPPRPMFSGAATAPPTRFTGLQLKGITGQKSRRLAIINNETMGAGETAMVKYGDGQVKIRLEGIGKDSVLVKVVESGERLELHLGSLAPTTPKNVPVAQR